MKNMYGIAAGDMFTAQYSMSVRCGSIDEVRPQEWGRTDVVVLIADDVMVIVYTKDRLSNALALTRIGYVWVYIHELIE